MKKIGVLVILLSVALCAYGLEEVAKVKALPGFLVGNQLHRMDFEEVIDPWDSFEETEPECVRPTAPGVYLVGAQGTWGPSDSGQRSIEIRKWLSATEYRVIAFAYAGEGVTPVGWQYRQTVGPELVEVLAGECLGVVVFHSSGSPGAWDDLHFVLSSFWVARQ